MPEEGVGGRRPASEGLENTGRGSAAAEGEDRVAEAAAGGAHGGVVFEASVLEGPEAVRGEHLP